MAAHPRTPKPKPFTVELTAPIRLMSGRTFQPGEKFTVIPHPKQIYYRRPVYLARSGFTCDAGFPCDLTIFTDECQVVQ